VDLQNPVPLQFDTGTNPRLGQTWDINQSFQVLGIPVTLSSAKAISQGDMQGFEFTVQAPLALHSMELGFEKSEGLVQTKERCCSSGGGSSPNQTGTFKVYALTDFSLAGGTINLSVRHVELSGNWSVTWNPPVVEGWPTATPLPQACLTDAKWNQIANGPAVPLPAGLGGKILTLRGALAPDPSLFLSGVDGSGEKGLVFGDGSLSPDGSKLVFAGQDDRLYVMDVESGVKTALTSSGIIGYRILWSPDGKHIAMNRFLENYHVVVLNADGTGLHRVTSGVSVEELAGWSPDGTQLLYTVLGDGGKHYLRLVNIDTGVVTELFAIDWKNPSPALSPDGKWVAFMDRAFGAFSASVYISRLDGSDRRLMAQLNAQPFFAYSPFWSPDGKWLAVSIQDANAFLPGDPSIALIQTDTCEVVPMPGVKGEIRSWVP
jgi:dipeptidyl aminopeptidase/acylaminoacyl peptidase